MAQLLLGQFADIVGVVVLVGDLVPDKAVRRGQESVNVHVLDLLRRQFKAQRAGFAPGVRRDVHLEDAHRAGTAIRLLSGV
jgi:hypothetical protein